MTPRMHLPEAFLTLANKAILIVIYFMSMLAQIRYLFLFLPSAKLLLLFLFDLRW